MIQRALSLTRRLELETLRHAGSLARIVLYKGEMPLKCELMAEGERVESIPASEERIRAMLQGSEPELIHGATYWRLLDNNGNVVMQGDGNGS